MNKSITALYVKAIAHYLLTIRRILGADYITITPDAPRQSSTTIECFSQGRNAPCLRRLHNYIEELLKTTDIKDLNKAVSFEFLKKADTKSGMRKISFHNISQLKTFRMEEAKTIFKQGIKAADQTEKNKEEESAPVVSNQSTKAHAKKKTAKKVTKPAAAKKVTKKVTKKTPAKKVTKLQKATYKGQELSKCALIDTLILEGTRTKQEILAVVIELMSDINEAKTMKTIETRPSRMRDKGLTPLPFMHPLKAPLTEVKTIKKKVSSLNSLKGIAKKQKTVRKVASKAKKATKKAA